MNGWVTKCLGEVIQKTRNIDPRKKPEDKFFYVDVSGVSNKTLEITEITELIGKDAPSRARRLMKEGDVIFATIRPTLRRIAIVPSDLDGEVCSTGYFVFQPNDELYNKFLYYYLQSDAFMFEMDRLQTGASYPAVNDSQVKATLISYPAIPEQKRIVAILDQAFADIDQARATAETNLKNARELFASYLQQVFSQGGDGWIDTTIGDETDLLTGYAFKSNEYVEHTDSVPLIRGDNVVQGKLRWDEIKLWPKDKVSEYKKYLLAENDIVLAMDRTWVKAGMKYSRVTDDDLPALLVQRVARLRCLNSLNSDYLYHLVGSKLFEGYVLSIQTGLGVPHISGKQIQGFRFKKPNIKHQKLVVDQFNKLENNVLQLTEIYQKKLSSLEELKKSILHKAFTGELTKSKGIAA